MDSKQPHERNPGAARDRPDSSVNRKARSAHGKAGREGAQGSTGQRSKHDR
jgi:hypothetical protein